MDIALQLAKELQIKKEQVDVTIKLIDEGNTIPFIARYRKDVTGNLNDEVLRNLNERLTYLRNLTEKQEQVISSIEEQGKMTEELRKQILEATTLVAVEDLYRPYRPKRKTRAGIAKEKGIKIGFLCEQVGMKDTYLADVARGKNRMTDDRLAKIAEILGTSVAYLNDETDDPAPVIGEPIPKSDLEKLQDMTIDMVRQLDDLQKLKMVYAALAASQKPKE